jgi:hypothetical protein
MSDVYILVHIMLVICLFSYILHSMDLLGYTALRYRNSQHRYKLYRLTSSLRCLQQLYHIFMFRVVSPPRQERVVKKYYGHKFIMKLCSGYAIISQVICALTLLKPVTLMQEIIKYYNLTKEFSVNYICI